ncbi:hypothetical protein IGI04_030730, partial [Brassica rapa subsp. trilocularis]
DEGRSEDEAVQLYFQRLTMTTMLRMVVKRSLADFLFLVTTHHTHGILETFSYMFSLCCLGWKPMTKKLNRFVLMKSVMIRIAHKEVHDAVFGGPARNREEDVKEAKESVENGNQSFG